MDSHEITADGDGRRQSDGNFFFVKTGFSSIKSPNSSRKSIIFFFWKSRKQYFILTPFVGSKNNKLTSVYKSLTKYVSNKNIRTSNKILDSKQSQGLKQF
jgi:hypothetical protein